MVKIPVEAVDATAGDKSVQFKLSPDPCNLKVAAVVDDHGQLINSKLMPLIPM